ncbi:universal stress protein [Clostridium saccharoperbutylacetonicum]|uniref:universal stress protein n=1 Tax=Clostridium saccharoperbutylacetonicum TaxID=36745 RepID=UPI0039EA1DAC
MNKRKVLIPIDGTEGSMHSLDFVKEIFPNDSIEIMLMNVKELVLINEMIVADEIKFAQELGEEILEAAKEKMKDYSKVDTYFTFGYPGDEIIKKAQEENIGVIVMTKSTKRGLNRIIGSVTTSVVKRSKCIVMIVPNDFTISLN